MHRQILHHVLEPRPLRDGTMQLPSLSRYSLGFEVNTLSPTKGSRFHRIGFSGASTVAILVISLVYLLVLAPGPGIALPWMSVDDGLFFHWTVSIRAGDWLGPWDYLTTAKGPLHSLLTAWASQLGISPFLYKRMFLLAGSLVFIYTVVRAKTSWLRPLLLLALLADPFQFGALGLRNLREGTYLPLQMVALGMGSLSLDRLRGRPLWHVGVLAPLFVMAFAFGLLLITREGRLIVYLEMLVWLSVALFAIIRYQPMGRRPFRLLLSSGLAVLLLIAVPRWPVSQLSSANQSRYGFSLSNSLEQGAFPRFFQALSGLRLKGDDRYIPRVAVKRRAIAVAIEELPDRPEGLRRILSDIDWGRGDYGCREFPDTCKDMASGWFLWAMRESVAKQLGKDASEERFQYVAGKAEAELREICTSSLRLECVPLSWGYLALPVRWGFDNLPLSVFREARTVIAKSFIPEPFPFGRPDLSRHTFSGLLPRSELERLGVRGQAESGRLAWQRVYVATSLLGAVGRWLLLCLALLGLWTSIGRRDGFHPIDPVCIWLFVCCLIQAVVYGLIGLSSFSGSPYTILTAPIAVGLYARVIDVSRPSFPAFISRS